MATQKDELHGSREGFISGCVIRQTWACHRGVSNLQLGQGGLLVFNTEQCVPTHTVLKRCNMAGLNWHCGQMLHHSCRCFHTRKRRCCLLAGSACYLFCLVDFQPIHECNMEAHDKERKKKEKKDGI